MYAHSHVLDMLEVSAQAIKVPFSQHPPAPYMGESELERFVLPIPLVSFEVESKCFLMNLATREQKCFGGRLWATKIDWSAVLAMCLEGEFVYAVPELCGHTVEEEAGCSELHVGMR